jgi:tetraacyldisaccharide 4'-kinase
VTRTPAPPCIPGDPRRGSGPGALEALFARHAWRAQPDALAQLLRPLAAVVALLAGLHRFWHLRLRRPQRAPVPVIVVGNLVVGGAGKTPVVIALVQALRAAGRRPGVISRGHGRREDRVRAVDDRARADDVGDEPLLIHRRTGVPVWAGRRRIEAARALCAAHPEVDVLVSDDGLQHHALARDAELIVFDERGAGNGLRLPAGPLRAALPATLPDATWVVYNAAAPTTPLPGSTLEPRTPSALPLADWWRGATGSAVPLAALRGRRLLALAGIGAPEKFFARLERAGLQIERCPQRDHARYDSLPWPADAAEVITTEKDAVKLTPAQVGATKVWVVPLDLALPADLVRALLQRLRAAPPA